MKKLFLLPVLFLLGLFVFSKNIEARSGCCSYHGGVCGCGCCDGTALSSTCAPYYPGCGGGYIYKPSCPLFSTYNSLNGDCECNYGYVASGSTCISLDQNCKNQYGYNARHNSLNNSCECGLGYVFSNGKCKSGNQVCWDKYGMHSTYTSLDDSCKCNYGYVFNKGGDKCISQDDWCEEIIGINSKFNLLHDTCECKVGYTFDNGRCILDIPDSNPNQFIPSVDKENTPSALDDTMKFSPEPKVTLSPSVRQNDKTLPLFIQELKNLISGFLSLFK